MELQELYKRPTAGRTGTATGIVVTVWEQHLHNRLNSFKDSRSRVGFPHSKQQAWGKRQYLFDTILKWEDDLAADEDLSEATEEGHKLLEQERDPNITRRPREAAMGRGGGAAERSAGAARGGAGRGHGRGGAGRGAGAGRGEAGRGRRRGGAGRGAGAGRGKSGRGPGRGGGGRGGRGRCGGRVQQQERFGPYAPEPHAPVVAAARRNDGGEGGVRASNSW
eukprot:scaffold43974_cov54-Attheya_sp.AAC.3